MIEAGQISAKIVAKHPDGMRQGGGLLHGERLRLIEFERRPITEQVSRHAMRLATTWERRYGAVPETIEEPGAAGAAVRARIGREAAEIMAEGMCCGGLNFGYFYESSPIVAYDGETAPGYTMADFTQSTVPGCRTPHLWLRDGRSLYDALGPDFTLLRLDPAGEIDSLVAAAARRRVPMEVLEVDAGDTAKLYPRKLLLSRPNRHVTWRGDRPPDDPLALIDRARGALAGEAVLQRAHAPTFAVDPSSRLSGAQLVT